MAESLIMGKVLMQLQAIVMLLSAWHFVAHKRQHRPPQIIINAQHQTLSVHGSIMFRLPMYALDLCLEGISLRLSHVC